MCAGVGVCVFDLVRVEYLHNLSVLLLLLILTAPSYSPLRPKEV